jgi:hypothetical protein
MARSALEPSASAIFPSVAPTGTSSIAPMISGLVPPLGLWKRESGKARNASCDVVYANLPYVLKR